MLVFEMVVPAYNEAQSLPALVKRVIQAAQGAGFSPHTFVLVVVNNGSTDSTAAVLADLQASEMGAWFRVVHVTKNTGYGAGLKAGLRSTKAAYVGFSHADLQCDPADAFAALQQCKALPHQAVVKGHRRGRMLQQQFFSSVFAAVAHATLKLGLQEINAQPKVFHRALLDVLPTAPDDFALDVYLLYRAKRAGYSIVDIDVDFSPRQHGTSKWAATLFGRHRAVCEMIQAMWHIRRREGPL